MIDRRNDWEPAWFVKLALIIGVLMALLTPPMCTPDEPGHYVNAYSISRGDIVPEVVDGTAGKYVSSQVINFVRKYQNTYTGKFDIHYSFGAAYFDSFLPNYDTSETFTTLYALFPIGYTASGLGMAVGARLGGLFEPMVGDLPYNQLLYGRLGNLAYYISIIYLALRIIPQYKRIMLILALMPMSIFLGASVNYDAMLIPTSFLLVAVVLRLMDERYTRVKRTDLLLILLCTFVLVGVKGVYAAFLLLLLAVPKEKYGGNKRLAICVAAVMLAAVIACMPYLIVNRMAAGGIDPNAEVLAEQREYVLHNLEKIPAVLINTIGIFSCFYLEGFWCKLGQIDTNFPVPVLAAFYVALIIVVVCEVSRAGIWKGKQWKRLLPACGFLLCVLGLFMSMYLEWTPLPEIAEGVGTPYVSGVQGRYFIPTFLPLTLCFSNSLFLRRGLDKYAEKVSYLVTKGCSALCGALTVVYVYARYW